MSIINIIKSAPLFQDLYDKEVESIIEKCNVLSLEKGDYVFKEGDEGDEIYIILTGALNVQKGETVFVQLSKGDLFGEMVILDERYRSADVVADTYSDVLVMHHDMIFGIFKKQPKIFSLLILNLSKLLTKRLKDTSDNMRKQSARIAELEALVDKDVA